MSDEPELDDTSYELMAEARTLLKMYEVNSKVDWSAYEYNGWSRRRRKRPFTFRYGPTRWVGYRHGTIPSQRESFAFITTFKTAASLLRAVKRVVTKVNI